MHLCRILFSLVMEVLLVDVSTEVKLFLIQYQNIQHICIIIQCFHKLSVEIEMGGGI